MKKTKHNVGVYYTPTYFDVDTGEVLENLSPLEKRKATHQFFKGINTGFEKLAKLPLSKMAYRLSDYILSVMDYNNKFYYDCGEFSSKLSCQCSAISAAIKELLSIEFCVPVEEKLYLVNPEFGFRGADSSKIQRWFNSLYQIHLKQKKLHQTNTTEQILLEKLKSAKLLAVSQYLVKSANDSHEVNKQVIEIVNDTNVSKMTIIPFLKLLEKQNFISRPQQGLIRLNPNFIQLINRF